MAQPVSWFEALLLGALQGLTEWLPVSSSGHLVILRELMDVEAPLFLDLVLHLATLIVVIVFYRHSLFLMLSAVAVYPREARRTGWVKAAWDHPDRRLLLFLALGTVPIVLAALAFEDWFLRWFESPSFVGWSLLATGVFLWFTRYSRSVRGHGMPLTWRSAMVVGVAQIAAILPGVSRSGTTVGMGLYAGIEPEEAVRYSFLLSIPAILGAILFQARDVESAALSQNWAAYAIGFTASLIVGYASLRFLVALVKNRILHWFAIYCWVAGAATLFWFGLAV